MPHGIRVAGGLSGLADDGSTLSFCGRAGQPAQRVCEMPLLLLYIAPITAGLDRRSAASAFWSLQVLNREGTTC